MEWPEETAGWFDDAGKAWCRDHEPVEHEGELTPALSTDDWLMDLGICAHPECHRLIWDVAQEMNG